MNFNPNRRPGKTSLLRWTALALGMLLIATGSAVAQTQSQPQTPNMTVTILGTAGGPWAHSERSGIATLVTVDQRNYLVDAGVGVARQLARAGVKEVDVPTVFLTHLHDDHTAGLPALMNFAWTRRTPKLELVGPPGTKTYFDAAMALIGVNSGIRMTENPRLTSPDKMFSAREVEPGQIYADDILRVTAIENTHYGSTFGNAPNRPRSYALKFQTSARTVVLTGDTGPSDALADFAQGADVLVSEIVSREDIASVPPFVREHMLKEHLTAADVGRLASKAKVGTVVLSHFREISSAEVDEIKRHFPGSVVIGSDLARF